jgi:hypothetical protein
LLGAGQAEVRRVIAGCRGPGQQGRRVARQRGIGADYLAGPAGQPLGSDRRMEVFGSAGVRQAGGRAREKEWSRQGVMVGHSTGGHDLTCLGSHQAGGERQFIEHGERQR